MKINRENYEAFLLDEQENNLSASEKQELDVFFQENTDLIPEREDHDSDFCLKDFPQDVFPYKENLLQKKSVFPVLLRVACVVIVFLLASGVYMLLRQDTNTEETKTACRTSKAKTPVTKAKKEPSDMGNIGSESNTMKPSAERKEIVFDTLYLVKDVEEPEDRYFSQQEKNYCLQIEILYTKEQKQDDLVPTNKMIMYETDN